MRRTYNVYDCINGEFVLNDAPPAKIQKEIGIKNKMVSRYADLGTIFHQQYRFEICREWDEAACSPFICVYDLRAGDYVMVDATARQISDKYGIHEKTVEQYASSSRAIKGTWLLFRSDRVPVKILLSDELIETWETVANMLNPRRKERKVG